MTNKKLACTGGEPIRSEFLGYGGQDIGEAEKEAVLEVLESDYITRGPTVKEFERRFADYVGAEHAVAVTSGTAALHLAGLAAGFGPGDEIVTTPFTFAATANAACYAGAEPVFADVKRDTRNVDPERIEERVTEETDGITPVHFAGQPCDIERILDIAEDNDLTVIWDACHAVGSKWRGDMVGGQQDMAVFSFHPVKTITTAEGGMVVTDDDELAEELRSLRSFRMDYDPEGHEDEPWYQVTEGLGYNYNFTDVQAAIGVQQLDRIDEFKNRRDEIIARYDDAFDGVPGIETPYVKDDVDPLFHLYAVEIYEEEFGCSRKEFVNAMHAENVGVQVHYVPLHHHPFFQERYGYAEGDFPVAEEVYRGIVSLPLTQAMSEGDTEDVVEAVERLKQYFDREGDLG